MSVPLTQALGPMTHPLRELTQDQYQATFSPRMEDVTEAADEIVNVWAYADPVLQRDFPEANDWVWNVKHIYESQDHVYQHLYIPVPKSETYLIIVVSKQQREIVGHYFIDFVAFYGDNGLAP